MTLLLIVTLTILATAAYLRREAILSWLVDPGDSPQMTAEQERRRELGMPPCHPELLTADVDDTIEPTLREIVTHYGEEPR